MPIFEPKGLARRPDGRLTPCAPRAVPDRSGLNQIPLIEWLRCHPDDLSCLEVAVGAMSGQLANIDGSTRAVLS